VAGSSSILQNEIAAEQFHIDRVYERLAEAERQARLLLAEGHRRGTVGNDGALVERDAMVYQAARRMQSLGREHEGLVFGRLDLADGLADLPFPQELRDNLLSKGRALPHREGSEQFVSYPVESDEDVAVVLEVLGWNYDRAREAAGPPAGDRGNVA